MSILITGGAGYIGGVTAQLLQESGEAIVVLDDLSTGYRDNVPAGIPFYSGSVGDSSLVKNIIDRHKVESCMHLAARALVGESVSDPAAYFENNVAQGIVLLNTLVQHGVLNFVFSSTGAVYGRAHSIPIPESHPQNPTNPYGLSKLLFEKMLSVYQSAYGVKYVALRFSNAAGGTEMHHERHDPETHLIPNVLSVAAGTRACVDINGDDHDTPDGTCVRDYIHVSDLAAAHHKALEFLRSQGGSVTLNLGTGRGYSVLEVIQTAEKVTGRMIPTRTLERRQGDPPCLVADGSLARKKLGWQPQITRLDEIIRSAWLTSYSESFILRNT
ncbi:MAG: UDP-glucose 4-epimerase GalE [Acidobacteria bacterium]|nr:UDP-glucose 4-epimerase GalE [Acidobacteriota bacterium]